MKLLWKEFWVLCKKLWPNWPQWWTSLSKRWPLWWLMPFGISTLCVVVLQVGPRPLAKAAGLVDAVEETSVQQHATEYGCTELRKEGASIPDDNASSTPYRPLGETWLLDAHETAVQEIRERISQEHIYFALKFSIIGAILVVLFRLTRRGDIDQFLQMRRAALFFSAALLACGIVDTRLRFNSLIMETLGVWIKTQVEPCVEALIKSAGTPPIHFEPWEGHFHSAGNSLVVATLRYFSVSLTALLYAVFLYLFIILPTRAHKPTLWLVLGTSVFLNLLLLPIGASYCELRDLAGADSPTQAIIAGLGAPAGLRFFRYSFFLSLTSVAMVGAMFLVEWKHKKYLLNDATERTLHRLANWERHLGEKADRLKTKMLQISSATPPKSGPTHDELKAELKACWAEKVSAQEKRKRLSERLNLWRKEVGLDRTGKIGFKEVFAGFRRLHGFFAEVGHEVYKEVRWLVRAIKRDPTTPSPVSPVVAPSSSTASESSPKDSAISPEGPRDPDEPVAVEDAIEYLWSMYFLERTRRQSLAKGPGGHAVTTEPTWWEFFHQT